MGNEELFEMLKEYHINENLMPFLNSNSDYTSLEAIADALSKEGSDHKVDEKGFMILANGAVLADRIGKGDFISDREIPQAVGVPSKNELFNYINMTQEADGAYLYNGKSKEIRKVQGFENNNNEIRKARKTLESMIIPPNFVYSKENTLSKEAIGKLGRKTDLAMYLPIAYTAENSNVEAFQVKRSRYGPLGLGKVTYFKNDGLHKEFYFDLDENKQIVGVTREYVPGLGNFAYKETRQALSELLPKGPKKNIQDSYQFISPCEDKPFPLRQPSNAFGYISQLAEKARGAYKSVELMFKSFA